MKRHPALAPLSRDHHHELVIAQRLRRATALRTMIRSTPACGSQHCL